MQPSPLVWTLSPILVNLSGHGAMRSEAASSPLLEVAEEEALDFSSLIFEAVSPPVGEPERDLEVEPELALVELEATVDTVEELEDEEEGFAAAENLARHDIVPIQSAPARKTSDTAAVAQTLTKADIVVVRPHSPPLARTSMAEFGVRSQAGSMDLAPVDSAGPDIALLVDDIRAPLSMGPQLDTPNLDDAVPVLSAGAKPVDTAHKVSFGPSDTSFDVSSILPSQQGERIPLVTSQALTSAAAPIVTPSQAPHVPVESLLSQSPLTGQVTVVSTETRTLDTRSVQARKESVDSAVTAAPDVQSDVEVGGTPFTPVRQTNKPDNAYDVVKKFNTGPAKPITVASDVSILPVLDDGATLPLSGSPSRAEGVSLTAAKALGAEVAPASSQVAQAVLQNGGKTTELRLSPEELGAVRVEVRHDVDRMVMMVSAERPETMDLLRRHAERLMVELRDAGLTNVDVGFQNWTSGRENSPAPEQSSSVSNVDPLDEIGLPVKAPATDVPPRAGLYIRI